MNMEHRMLRALALAAVALGFACTALAQTYPSRPIKIIVPFPPGNTMDIMSRLIGPRLNEEINRAMRLPDVEDKLVAAGLLVVAETPACVQGPSCSLRSRASACLRSLPIFPRGSGRSRSTRGSLRRRTFLRDRSS